MLLTAITSIFALLGFLPNRNVISHIVLWTVVLTKTVSTDNSKSFSVWLQSWLLFRYGPTWEGPGSWNQRLPPDPPSLGCSPPKGGLVRSAGLWGRVVLSLADQNHPTGTRKGIHAGLGTVTGVSHSLAIPRCCYRSQVQPGRQPLGWNGMGLRWCQV